MGIRRGGEDGPVGVWDVCVWSALEFKYGGHSLGQVRFGLMVPCWNKPLETPLFFWIVYNNAPELFWMAVTGSQNVGHLIWATSSGGYPALVTVS
ncbi:hypothetical protein VTI74DRAFT_10845 [Chaetomium olivicolor]